MLAEMKSSEYKDLMSEIRMSFGGGDEWGTNIGWLFGIADVLTFDCGYCPADFRPSPLGPAEECYEYEVACTYSFGTLKTAYTVLSRYDDWLRLAGKNY